MDTSKNIGSWSFKCTVSSSCLKGFWFSAWAPTNSLRKKNYEDHVSCKGQKLLREQLMEQLANVSYPPKELAAHWSNRTFEDVRPNSHLTKLIKGDSSLSSSSSYRLWKIFLWTIEPNSGDISLAAPTTHLRYEKSSSEPSDLNRTKHREPGCNGLHPTWKRLRYYLRTSKERREKVSTDKPKELEWWFN